jgi:predicted nucleic acid-binding protein
MQGVSVPDPAGLAWVEIRTPIRAPILPLVTELGRGETQVLALAKEIEGSVPVLDDGLARSVAHLLGLPLKGTLGLLVDANRKNLIPAVRSIQYEFGQATISAIVANARRRVAARG